MLGDIAQEIADIPDQSASPRQIGAVSRAAILLLAAALALTCGRHATADTPEPRDSGRMRGAYRSSYLHVDGRRLLTADGRDVALHGINLGGWLVIEDWMCGITDDQDTLAANGPAGVAGRAAADTLEQRFGPDAAATLARLWQDGWIMEADLDLIRQGGFNVVRVPISYRTLQHADGSWILDARGRIDFTRMDWIVRQAAARGIYTIFVLHVWPEQRHDYVKIGKPEGAPIRDAMARLWTVIARHYRDNGAVAAFDLINEFPGAWGVQQVLADAVRQGDARRVQVIEGFTFAEYLKLRAAGTFPGSVFSDHFYDASPLSTDAIEKRLDATKDSPFPVYIGEFQAADFAAATQAMNKAGVSWSSWTYKTVDMGEWGAFNYSAAMKTDIQRDSYADLATKFASLPIAVQDAAPVPGYTLNIQRLTGSDAAAGPLP